MFAIPWPSSVVPNEKPGKEQRSIGTGKLKQYKKKKESKAVHCRPVSRWQLRKMKMPQVDVALLWAFQTSDFSDAFPDFT